MKSILRTFLTPMTLTSAFSLYATVNMLCSRLDVCFCDCSRFYKYNTRVNKCRVRCSLVTLVLPFSISVFAFNSFRTLKTSSQHKNNST